MQEGRSAAASRIKGSVPAVKPAGHHSTGPAFQHYQAAVQLLQQAKYDKALAAFEKLRPSAPPEILERCKMYISTCRRQWEQPVDPSPHVACLHVWRLSHHARAAKQSSGGAELAPVITILLPTWRVCGYCWI